MAMDPNHPYRKLSLGPGHPPFELRPSPGKGWGAFATKHLTPGDLVFKQRPLIVIRKHILLITEQDVLMSMMQLSPFELQQITYVTRGRQALTVLELFHETEFTVTSNPPAHGMYLILARFNHSCVPNCRIPTLGGEGGELIMQAAKVIKPGEELTFTYDPTFQYLTSHERALLLDFVCKCPACLAGTLFNLTSNMRRTLIRGLFFLTHGRETEDDMPKTMRPLLTDPEMIKKAKDLTIPLSTRFIAVLVMAFLLAQEGMMDHTMAATLLPNMHRLAATFRSARNLQIATNAMKHGSFLGKFTAAFKLYGKKDLADRELAAALQEARRNMVL